MDASREENPLEIDTEMIGPTSCNENRTARTNDIENVWEMIKIAIEKLAKQPKIILLSLSIKPTDLFREATSCYQNGAYLATCALCRTSLESLLYVIVTREIVSNSSAEPKYDYVRSKRTDLLSKVIQDGLLDKEDNDVVNKIWNEGDFVVHYSQKLDRTYLELPRKNLEYKYWIEKNDALNILNETAFIISKILTRWSSSN